MRRRWAQRERLALAMGRLLPLPHQSMTGLVGDDMFPGSAGGGLESHGHGMASHFQPETHGAIETLQEQNHTENLEQPHDPDHSIAQLDYSSTSDLTSGRSSPPNEKKSGLTCFSTSAEIVEELLSDCPAPASYPRRTASVCSSYERKSALTRSTEDHDPESQDCEFRRS